MPQNCDFDFDKNKCSALEQITSIVKQLESSLYGSELTVGIRRELDDVKRSVDVLEKGLGDVKIEFKTSVGRLENKFDEVVRAATYNSRISIGISLISVGLVVITLLVRLRTG